MMPSRQPRPILFPLGLAVILAFLPVTGYAGSADEASPDTPVPAADKRQYNLFHPTPDGLLREFSSSRPDQTTGPRWTPATFTWKPAWLTASTWA